VVFYVTRTMILLTMKVVTYACYYLMLHPTMTSLMGQVENIDTKLANQMSMQITSYCSYLLESTAGAACPGGSLRHRIIQ
jgi:hypothetical protein